MAVTISGDTGISAVQAGAVESGDLPAGSVIQVVHDEGNTSTSVLSGSQTLYCGWTESINLSSVNNKILVQAQLPAAVRRENGGRPYLLDVTMYHQQGTLSTTGSGGSLQFDSNVTSKIIFDLHPAVVTGFSSVPKEWDGWVLINQLVTTSNLENHFTFSHRTNSDMVESHWNRQFGDGSFYQISLMEVVG